MKAQEAGRHHEVLRKFTEVYCRELHRGARAAGEAAGRAPDGLCPECRDLVEYGRQRLLKCPYDPKPACKDCKTHCYKPEYRERVREVMRFSGMHFVKRGRLDWLIRYFMT